MKNENKRLAGLLKSNFRRGGLFALARPGRMTIACLSLFAFSAFCSNGWAILIGFEASEGYSLGNLVNQPNTGTQWIGTANASSYAPLQVVSGQGIDGGNAIQVQSSLAANSAYRFAPSNADLGGVFSASSSVLSLSFSLRWDSINTSSTGIGRFYIGAPTIGGTPTVLSLDWYSNGRIGFNDGTFQYATDSTGAVFAATAGAFYTITATLDYATGTYLLTVNDVTQSRNGNENISFRNPTGTLNNIIDITTLNNQNANFQNWTIDNINYSIVPEPSTMALACLSLAGLLLFRKRPKLA